jgi:hypothetical protein
VRWKAKGALSVRLLQDNTEIPTTFRPSDEYETTIQEITAFKAITDYGQGEQAEKSVTVHLSNRVKENGKDYIIEPVIPIKPTEFHQEGSLNATFNALKDFCSDNKVQGINSLEVRVSSILDYRKIGTSINLLNRPQYNLTLDQILTVQAQGQFIRLEYQGDPRGFSNLFNPLNNLFNSPDTQGEVTLKLVFDFPQAIKPDGSEVVTILQSLSRNPVERLTLAAKVTY